MSTRSHSARLALPCLSASGAGFFVAAFFGLAVAWSAVFSAGDAAAESVACEAGRSATTKTGACVPNAVLAAANKCEAAGWVAEARSYGAICGQLAWKHIAADRNHTLNCILDDPSAPHDYGCSQIFGPEFNFPSKAKYRGDQGTFVAHCGAGMVPETYNTRGEVNKCCPPGEVATIFTAKDCGASATEAKRSAGGDKCLEAGWDITREYGCNTPVMTVVVVSGLMASECTFTGGGNPNCTDVFGENYDFPTKPTDGSEPRYVFNCDPDGSKKLVTATVNTVGYTRCECDPAVTYTLGDLCLPKEGDFGEASEEDLCRAFGGMVQTATGGKVCSGMDANDTFCILDSQSAFPCRGLFKHMRNCKLRHARKALNPFFCGSKYPSPGALGADYASSL